MQDCKHKHSNHAKFGEHLHRFVLNFFADVVCALWIVWLDQVSETLFDRADSDSLLLSRLDLEGLDDNHVLHQPVRSSGLV